MSASDVSLSFHLMSHHPLTLAAGRFFVWLLVFGCLGFVFVSCFASVMGFYRSSACIRSR